LFEAALMAWMEAQVTRKQPFAMSQDGASCQGSDERVGMSIIISLRKRFMEVHMMELWRKIRLE